MKTKDMVLCGFLAAILFVLQVVFGFLPNVEPVTILIIIFTLVLERKTLVIIYTFALLEGIFYGFGIWWIMYLYVWTILYFIVRLMRKNESVVIWAIVGGGFGLAFGALCAIPYAVAGGIGAGISWWTAGILFDIFHGVGNFFIILILFKPVYNIVSRLAQIY